MSKTQATEKTPGKIAQLKAMWAQAGDGTLLPRNFAIALAVEQGFNASTARTQYQAVYREAQAEVEVQPPPQ